MQAVADNNFQTAPGAYETARLQRIAQNNQRLSELGLSGTPFTLPCARSRVPRNKQPAEESKVAIPLRRSQRQQNVQIPTELPPASVRPQYESKYLSDAEALDQLNLLRVRTMSHKAMQQRIVKIRRIDKLESLIQILEAEGMDDLASQAEQALKTLLLQEQC